MMHASSASVRAACRRGRRGRRALSDAHVVTRMLQAWTSALRVTPHVARAAQRFDCSAAQRCTPRVGTPGSRRSCSAQSSCARGRPRSGSSSWPSRSTPARPVVSAHSSSPLRHLRRDWARPCHTSAPGLGKPLPHLRRDWAHPYHICAGTGLAPATSAPGLGSPLPHLRRDWARRCHICAGTGLAAATSAPGRALVATVPCAPVLPLTDRASARRAEGDHQQECWYC